MTRTAVILTAALAVSDRIAAGDPSWPDDLVQQLSCAVGVDTAGFAGNLERGLMGLSVNVGGPPLSSDERLMWTTHWDEYPFFGDLLRGEAGTAVRSSDRIPSMAEFRRTTIYAEHFAPRHAEHHANFGIVVDGTIAIVGLYRKSRDFSPAEIEALERTRLLLVQTLTYRATLSEVEQLADVSVNELIDIVLTPRQQRVLALVATGATDRDISRQLGISERTARKHLTDIRRRLHVSGRVAAARWYLNLNPRRPSLHEEQRSRR